MHLQAERTFVSRLSLQSLDTTDLIQLHNTFWNGDRSGPGAVQELYILNQNLEARGNRLGDPTCHAMPVFW